MTTGRDTSDLERRNRRIATTAAFGALAMLGAAFAAVPLYDIFCRVTGYGGTTQRTTVASTTILDRTITVRFDANVGGGLPWKFEPVERRIDVRIGETTLAFYRATNLSDRPVVGTAAFNVAPEVAGIHFNKMACFCFTEQRLEPGESVEMPVSFYVDPKIVDDKDARSLSQITLSYTFYPVERPKSVALPETAGGRS